MLLAHAHSIIIAYQPLRCIGGISIEGLENYVDNEPNTDSPEDPFIDEEDDAAV